MSDVVDVENIDDHEEKREVQTITSSSESGETIVVVDDDHDDEDADELAENVGPPKAHVHVPDRRPSADDNQLNSAPPGNAYQPYRPLESYANNPMCLPTGIGMPIAVKLRHLTTADAPLIYFLYPFHQHFIDLHRLLCQLDPAIRAQSGLISANEVAEAQNFAIEQLAKRPRLWADFITQVIVPKPELAALLTSQLGTYRITLQVLHEAMSVLDTCCGLARHQLVILFLEKVNPQMNSLPEVMSSPPTSSFNQTWLAINCPKLINPHTSMSASLRLWLKYDAYTVISTWWDEKYYQNGKYLAMNVVKALLAKAVRSTDVADLDIYSIFVNLHLGSETMLTTPTSCAVYEHLCAMMLKDEWVHLASTPMKVWSYEHILRQMYARTKQLCLPRVIRPPNCELTISVEELIPLRREILPRLWLELCAGAREVEKNNPGPDWKSREVVQILLRERE